MSTNKETEEYLKTAIKYHIFVRGIPTRAALIGNDVGWFIAANDAEAAEYEQFTLDVLYSTGKVTVEQFRATLAEYRKEHPVLTEDEEKVFRANLAEKAAERGI